MWPPIFATQHNGISFHDKNGNVANNACLGSTENTCMSLCSQRHLCPLRWLWTMHSLSRRQFISFRSSYVRMVEEFHWCPSESLPEPFLWIQAIVQGQPIHTRPGHPLRGELGCPFPRGTHGNGAPCTLGSIAHVLESLVHCLRHRLACVNQNVKAQQNH